MDYAERMKNLLSKSVSKTYKCEAWKMARAKPLKASAGASHFGLLRQRRKALKGFRELCAGLTCFYCNTCIIML